LSRARPLLGYVEFVGGGLLARGLGDEVVEEHRDAHLEAGQGVWWWGEGVAMRTVRCSGAGGTVMLTWWRVRHLVTDRSLQ